MYQVFILFNFVLITVLNVYAYAIYDMDFQWSNLMYQIFILSNFTIQYSTWYSGTNTMYFEIEINLIKQEKKLQINVNKVYYASLTSLEPNFDAYNLRCV